MHVTHPALLEHIGNTLLFYNPTQPVLVGFDGLLVDLARRICLPDESQRSPMQIPSLHTLIERNDSLLIVIDVQDYFLRKLESPQAQSILERIAWLMRVAEWCGVPMLVTVEDLATLGGPSPAIHAAMTSETELFDKLTFGLADQADILAAVAATQRTTAILVGLETDVCIMQSALGLLARGYRVVVLADATGSPGGSHDSGVARMRAAGVTITECKGLVYEWLRSVAESRRFDVAFAAVPVPQGMVL